MSARRTLPRRGLADPSWRYVPADQTDIAKTIRAEQARLASQGSTTAFEERDGVRECIATLQALTDDEVLALAADDAPADVPLPLPPLPRGMHWEIERWDHVGPGSWRAHAAAVQTGRLDPDAAVALIALGLLAAACRFGGLF